MKKPKEEVLPFLNWDAFRLSDTDPELDAKLNAMREAYTNAMSDILEATVANCVDAETAQAVAQDFAMFSVFFAAVKMVEIAGVPGERREFLSAFNYLLKRQERVIPEHILALVEAVAAAPDVAAHMANKHPDFPTEATEELH